MVLDALVSAVDGIDDLFRDTLSHFPREIIDRLPMFLQHLFDRIVRVMQPP